VDEPLNPRRGSGTSDRVKTAVKVAHITTIDLSLRFLLLNQLVSLAREGFDVVGVSAPGEHAAAVEEAGIPCFAVPMTRRVTPLADLAALWRLYRLMRRERFTIVHVHTPKPALLGQLAARAAGVPVIVTTLHGLTFRDDTPRAKRHLLMLLEKACALMSDFILSQNPDDIETFVNEGIASRDKLRFLGNGIDVERFDPARVPAETKEKLRAQLGIRPGDKVVGFIGRLVVEKGILELVTAMAEVARRVPGARLLVVGPSGGEKSDAMSKDDARFDPVRDVAIFTGLRHDMPEMLALMDVFVLPSHREGFPRSPMEAAAMGKPAIVTDITGCRETVVNGLNGYLFPKGDAATLAARIEDLLASPERARAFGEAGRRLAEERFDERKVFRIVADTYRALLAKKGIAAPEGPP
jgi:glycosyltransferase involved in cell wall biosynthesis